MLFCREANWNTSRLRTGVLRIYLLLVAIFQAASVDGRSLSVVSPENSSLQQSLEFTSPNPITSDAGYGTLTWNALSDANTYVIRRADDERQIYYEGALSRAFVSGLPDGEYRFHVEAWDATSTLIARSSQPAVVQVQHFSMLTTWILFSIGLVVVVSVLWIIVRGSLWHGQSSAQDVSVDTPQLSSDPSGGSDAH